MTKTLIIHDEGKRLLIRIVSQNDHYGRAMNIIHEKDDPLIEFYDYDINDTYDGDIPLGQFISRYYIRSLRSSTLSPPFTRKSTHGLDLHGGVPKWSISAAGMNSVMRFIHTHESFQSKQAS